MVRAGHWPALYLSEGNQTAARTCSLATKGTQEGRITHHHTDATVLALQATASITAHRGSTRFLSKYPSFVFTHFDL